MAITTINIGTEVNDGTGDPIRSAFDKVNADLLYLDAESTFNNRLYNSNVFGGTTTLTAGNASVLGDLDVNQETSTATLRVTSSVNSTSGITGAAVITGGLGVGGNVVVSGNLIVAAGSRIYGVFNDPAASYVLEDSPIGQFTPREAAFTTLEAYGQTSLYSGTQSTSTATGALIVVGGVGIGKNLTVGGNATVANLAIVDNVTGNVNFTGEFITINGAQIATAGNAFTGGNVKNQAIFNATINSIDPGTGAVLVKGGLGVQGNISIGGFISGGNLNLDTSTGHLELGNVDLYSNGAIFGNLRTGAQPGITSVGSLNGLTVSGNVVAGLSNQHWIGDAVNPFLRVHASRFQGDLYGLVQTALQPGITSVGTLTGLTVTGTAVLGSVSSNVVVAATTGSTTTTTGALVVKGGAGIAGNLHAGAVKVGQLTYSDNNILGVFQNSVNTYNQTVLQNSNSGSSASSDLIVNNDQSTASSYYGDFGINSSTYSGSGSLALPNAVYLTATTGDLVLGTTTANAVRFVINSGGADAAIIDSNGNLVVNTATASTSGTTGALVVAGGIGVGGNVYSNRLYTTTGIFWAGNNTPVNGQPGGATSQIQYNDNTSFAGAGNFTYTAANGNVVIGSTVDSTSSTTGALVVGGGAGINGDLYVNGTIYGAVVGTISTTGGIDGTEIGIIDPAAARFTTIGATTAVATNFSTGNAVISGGYISGLANATVTTGNAGSWTATTLNATAGNVTTLRATNFNSANIVVTAGNAATLHIATLNSSAGNVTVLRADNFNSPNAVITGGYISSLANAYISTGSVTNFSTGNAVISGGYISALTNATVTTGNVGSWYAATLNASTANISTAQATNLSTGNAVISGGYISALSNATVTTGNAGSWTTATLNATSGNITTLRANNFSSGNAVISGGYISALSNATVTTGNAVSWYATTLNTTTANITGGVANTLVITNFSTANARITGGNIDGTAIGATTKAVGTFTTLTADTISVAGGGLNSTSIGATTPSTGKFTTLESTSVLLAQGNIVANSGVDSSSTTTGALVVAGGVGASHSIVIGSNATVGQSTASTRANLFVYGGALNSAPGSTVRLAEFSTVNTNSSYLQILNQRFASGSDWNSANTRIQQAIDTSGMGYVEFNPVGALRGVAIGSTSGEIIRFHNTSGNVVIASNTQTTSANTGALITTGGIAINTGNLFIGGSAGTAIVARGNILPSANLLYDIGSSTSQWNTVYGKSVQAQYADLAEIYLSDKEYGPGTVVVIGGDAEITVTTEDHDPRVAGVISTDPAYLMNSGNPGLPVALTGRVPCRVQGPVAKGTVLVTSATPGVAQAMDPARYQPGCVIGKSLQAIADNDTQVIEIMVGRF